MKSIMKFHVRHLFFHPLMKRLRTECNEIILMKLNITLLEFLTAYNSVVWVPQIETGGVLMANNVPLVFICGAHRAQLRAARISSGLLKL